MKRKIFLNLICLIFVFITLSQYCFAAPDNNASRITTVDQHIEKIINYKKSNSVGDIIDGDMLDRAFNFTDAKFVIALSQNNTFANYRDYAYVLQNILKEKYSASHKLNTEKSFTGAQMSLALLSCGINPYEIEHATNERVNLLADTIYKRDSAYPLGKDGMEGYAWGLIALNAFKYRYDTNILAIRESFMEELLALQSEDGSYSTSTNVSPYYLSALSVIALAPEYNYTLRKDQIRTELLESQKAADEKRKAEGEKITFEEYVKKEGILEEPTLYDYVDMSVDTSLDLLSESQADDGSYKNQKDYNIQITSSTIMALCAMGIDPEEDTRFIKNSQSLIDGLLKYQKPDGSFVFSETSDVYSDTIDAFAALVTYKLFLAGKISIYDFSYKPLKQNYTMLRVSDKDIENIKYISQNFDLSKYTYVCIVNEKLLNSKRSDKHYWLSVIENIKTKKKQREAVINYIKEKGNELLYSESGINVRKKNEIKDLLKLCEALPKEERKYITVYDDLKAIAIKVQNAIALETLLLAAILLAVISFILSVLMYLIKKDTLRKKINMYNHYEGKGSTQSQKNGNKESSQKNKKMPFELEDNFFDYEAQEEIKQEPAAPSAKPLPFETDGFFEYESHEQPLRETDDKDDFSLPFEEDTNFFEYESSKANNELEDSEDMLPFEKEKNFFKYK